MKNTDEFVLRQLLESAYGLVQPEISWIRTGGDGNQTFKVITTNTTYITRIYGEQGQKHSDWARYELELLAHLASNGISVAAPVATRNGEWMSLLGSEGNLPAPVALFAFAEGGVEWPTTPDRAHLLGVAFAQLHVVADTFYTVAEHRTFDKERLLDAPLQQIHAYLTDTNAEDRAAWETLSQVATQVAVLLANIPDTGDAIGPIHGDLHQGNCHFNRAGDGDQLTFFDFSNAGVGWRVYDLSGFLWPLRDDTITQPAIKAACDAFLDGYRSLRPLSWEEEKAIPAAVKARDFWETGSWLEFGENLDLETVRAGLHSLADQFRRFPIG